MEHWYEMEGFAADPIVLETYERASQRLLDIANAHPHDPTIQALAAANQAQQAHVEMLAQHIQSILKILGKGKL